MRQVCISERVCICLCASISRGVVLGRSLKPVTLACFADLDGLKPDSLSNQPLVDVQSDFTCPHTSVLDEISAKVRELDK